MRRVHDRRPGSRGRRACSRCVSRSGATGAQRAGGVGGAGARTGPRRAAAAPPSRGARPHRARPQHPRPGGDPNTYFYQLFPYPPFVFDASSVLSISFYSQLSSFKILIIDYYYFWEQ